MLEIAIAAFAVGGGMFASGADSGDQKRREQLREYTRQAKAEAAAKTLQQALDAEQSIAGCGRTIASARAVVDEVFDQFVKEAKR